MKITKMEGAFIMNFNEYQKYVQDGMSSAYNLQLGCLGLAGEVGEVCDLIKKDGIYPNKISDLVLQDKIVDELGDVMWQAFAIANIIGIPMVHIIESNIAKLNLRHGGAGKTDTTGGKR